MKSILPILLLMTATLSAEPLKVLINQVGYEISGPKRAVLIGNDSDTVSGWRLICTDCGKVFAEGKAKDVGRVEHWKDWHFWTIDFDDVTTDMPFVLEVDTNRGTITSDGFHIEQNILERNTLGDAVSYFRSQRIVGQQDIADHHLKFEGDPDPNHTVDLHGGWADATGDAGKHLSHLSFASYFNPQHGPLTTWALLKAYARLGERNDKNFTQVRKKILDEAMYGADYLCRSKSPTGSFFRSVDDDGKRPEDRYVAKDKSGGIFGAMKDNNPLHDGSEKKLSPTFEYEVSFRAGGAMSIAALALASRQDVHGDYTSEQYLKAAEDADAFLGANNLVYVNDAQENIIDDYTCLIAETELYAATKNNSYKHMADIRAGHLMSRMTDHGWWSADGRDRPFFHPSDAGLPVVALLNYLSIADEAQREVVQKTVKQSLQHELSMTDSVTNPFGLARQVVQGKDGVKREAFFFPHDSGVSPWWQGENARLASLATAARMASRLMPSDRSFNERLAHFATDQLNWILGCNPYDACMLRGHGHNNPQYIVNGTWQYIGAPGGIANGITAGVDDPLGIDFNPADPKYANDTWRWDEQWLPHTTWYLLAVAEGPAASSE